MSKNIYNESGFSSNQNIETSQIVTDTIQTNEIIIPNSHKGDILFIGDSNTVEGLLIGNQDDVLCSDKDNTGLPIYKNDLNLNTVTCNDIKINGLQTGDLIVGITNNFVDRLAIGPSGYILTSNGSQVQWNPISLPFNNAMLFVNGSGLIYGERASYGLSPAPITFTTSTTIFSLNVTTVNTRNYKVSISFNNIISGGGQNSYSLNISGIGTFLTYVTANTSSQENIILPFNANATGNISISLIGAHTGPGNGTSFKVYILCEPLGY